jgi:hypothetical protein
MTVVKITNLTEAERVIRKHVSYRLELCDILLKDMRGFGFRGQNWFCRIYIHENPLYQVRYFHSDLFINFLTGETLQLADHQTEYKTFP